MRRHALTDEQWSKVQKVLKVRRGPRSNLGDRNFVDAVLWRIKTGAPWRDLPERFGPYQTIYNRFARWAHRGWWEEIFRAVQVIDDDDIAALMDATIVRAHQDAAGGKGGSTEMLLAVLLGDSPRKSTSSRTARVSRSTRSSQPANAKRRPKP